MDGHGTEEVGPTVDDLAAALEQQPMRDATVSDIEVDGFAGTLVSMSVPDDLDVADCDRASSAAGSTTCSAQAGSDDVYILDVDGTRVVIDVVRTTRTSRKPTSTSWSRSCSRCASDRFTS